MTISNVDEEVAAEELAPYEWSFQDAESLDYPDGSFDLTVVSAGLHHCRSPHRALLELYRVARVAALALESRDSALMRVAVKLGAVDDYELAAVAAHGLRSGGVANTSTPNYVYRWSEREVEKTVASFAPHARHRIRFFREFELPEAVVEIDRGARAGVLRLARPVVTLITRVLPRQANLFAFSSRSRACPPTCRRGCGSTGGSCAPTRSVVGTPVRGRRSEPRAAPAGLGAPRRDRPALGGADAPGPQGRPLGRGRVLRDRRGRDRTRLLRRRLARPPGGSASARSTSAAASAGSPAPSAPASSTRSASTSRPRWSTRRGA